GCANKWSRTSTGQMVQPASWLRFPYARGGDARHFCAHGNAAALRHDRIAPRPVRPGAVWTGTKRADGGGGAAGERAARARIALDPAGPFFRIAFTHPLQLLAALVVAGWAFAMAVPVARAGGQDTIEIVTRTGVHAFSVELATNAAERALGLMYRKELPEGRGLLLDFQQAKRF